jgi:3-isopropylmalate dehydratase small subunit
VERFEVDLEKQTVIVHPTTATYDEVLEKIKKTGKEVGIMMQVERAGRGDLTL